MKNIKLLEVTGYYQEENTFNFVEEKSWKGTVILREDLTFEGIVVDNLVDNNFDRLVSGTLVDYNGASFIKFSNHGLCPCSFFGMSTGKEVIGSWAVHSRFFVNDAGRCKMVFKEIPMYDAIIENIEQRIESFKSEMDSVSSELYESLIENMNCTVKEFIQNMNANRANIEKEIGYPLKKLEL